MESTCSRYGLNGFNFFVAAVQTGFGPFVAVWLTRNGWSKTDVGIALSIGTGAALLGQLPGGWLVDLVHRKRPITTIALMAVAVAALMMAFVPTQAMVWAAEALASLAACIITPAIAAITLRLCGHVAYSERLGVNARFASLGAASAAALFGLVAWLEGSERSVFVVAALLVVPASISLHSIAAADQADDDHRALLHPRARRSVARPMHIYNVAALHIYAVCTVLFHLANAAMLPLALSQLALHSQDTGLYVSLAIIAPQAIVAALSPWVGSLAQTLGRRPVLVVGFLALPLRGLLFAWLAWAGPAGIPLVMIQLLDGVSATVFGLSIPMIAADTTRQSGYLNLAIGSLGFAAGLGGTASTTIAGYIADTFGGPMAFLGLAAVGAAACALVWLVMPETKPARPVGRPGAFVVAA